VLRSSPKERKKSSCRPKNGEPLLGKFGGDLPFFRREEILYRTIFFYPIARFFTHRVASSSHLPDRFTPRISSRSLSIAGGLKRLIALKKKRRRRKRGWIPCDHHRSLESLWNKESEESLSSQFRRVISISGATNDGKNYCRFSIIILHKRGDRTFVAWKSDLAEITSVPIPVSATEKKKTQDEGPNISRLVPRKNSYATRRKKQEKEKESVGLERCVVGALFRETRAIHARKPCTSLLGNVELLSGGEVLAVALIKKGKGIAGGMTYKWIDDPLDGAVYKLERGARIGKRGRRAKIKKKVLKKSYSRIPLTHM